MYGNVLKYQFPGAKNIEVAQDVLKHILILELFKSDEI